MKGYSVEQHQNMMSVDDIFSVGLTISSAFRPQLIAAHTVPKIMCRLPNKAQLPFCVSFLRWIFSLFFGWGVSTATKMTRNIKRITPCRDSILISGLNCLRLVWQKKKPTNAALHFISVRSMQPLIYTLLHSTCTPSASLYRFCLRFVVILTDLCIKHSGTKQKLLVTQWTQVKNGVFFRQKIFSPCAAVGTIENR